MRAIRISLFHAEARAVTDGAPGPKCHTMCDAAEARTVTDGAPGPKCHTTRDISDPVQSVTFL